MSKLPQIQYRPATEKLMQPINEDELELFNHLLEMYCIGNFMAAVSLGNKPSPLMDLERIQQRAVELEIHIMSNHIIIDNCKKFKLEK